MSVEVPFRVAPSPRTSGPSSVQFLVEPVMREGPTLTITAFPYGDEVGVLFSGTSPHEEVLHRLRRERALLAAVAADPRMSNVQLTLRGGITAADESFAVLTGFSQAELTSMMLTELLHPHDRASVTRALDEALRAVSSATILAAFWHATATSTD